MIGGFSVLFFMSVVFLFARRRWKRRGAALPSGLGVESQRLERLENGMEAIAIEIERVSEGQRFVTRLLSESQSPLGTSHRTVAAGVETTRRRPQTPAGAGRLSRRLRKEVSGRGNTERDTVRNVDEV